jgi:hypothetical protein
MYATTVLVDPSMTSHVFEDAEALMSLEPARLNPAPRLKLFSASESPVINKVYGDSRRDFFSQAVENLCTLSGIHGLEFFHGNLEIPWRWKLPLGIEDGEENIYGYACGYWLEGTELAAAHAALSRLLEWSQTNIKRIKDGAILRVFQSSGTPEND